jgi:hypothetical protein
VEQQQLCGENSTHWGIADTVGIGHTGCEAPSLQEAWCQQAGKAKVNNGRWILFYDREQTKAFK